MKNNKKKFKIIAWLRHQFNVFVMPKIRIKIWKEDDGWNGIKFYYNDKIERVLLKSICGVNIEFRNIKVNIFISYKEKVMKRYEVKVWNEKDQMWHVQTFATKREADARKKTLRANGYKVK